MAYEKQTWTDNLTLIDAEKMNHIEAGLETLDNEKLNKQDLTNVEVAVQNAMNAANNAAAAATKAENAANNVANLDQAVTSANNAAAAATEATNELKEVLAGANPEAIGAAPVVHTHDYTTLLNIPTRTLLWENPKPSAAMAADTEINLSSGDYDELVVYYKPNASVSSASFSMKADYGLRGHGIQMVAMTNADEGCCVWYRTLNYQSDTKYTIGLPSGFKNGDTYWPSANKTEKCIPYRIYGIKYPTQEV